MSRWSKMLGAAAAAGLMGSAGAVTVTSMGPAPASYDVSAQARNGRTGFEAILHTANPVDPNMNPGGAPAWSYGNYHGFEYTYDYSTGTSTWSIDFNRDNDFADAQESVSATVAALAGQSFEHLNIYLQGRTLTSGNAEAHLRGLTINSSAFGPYSSTSDTAFQQLFTDSTGLFGNITVSGELMFSKNGASDERPRFWIQLGDAQQVVPMPTAAGLGFAGLAMAGLRRRR